MAYLQVVTELSVWRRCGVTVMGCAAAKFGIASGVAELIEVGRSLGCGVAMGVWRS